MKQNRSFLQMAGSLRLAAGLLVLISVAMACATFYETSHGLEWTRRVFYQAWWFELLLILLGLNVIASLLDRWPFRLRQMGFVLAHASLLLIFVGAWVTQAWSWQGSVTLAPGQSAEQMVAADSPVLTVRTEQEEAPAQVFDLPASIFEGFEVVERPHLPVFETENLKIEVERFLPDSEEINRMVDGRPDGQPAVQLSLMMPQRHPTAWVMAGQTANLAMVQTAFRVIGQQERLDKMLTTQPATQPASKGTVEIRIGQEKFDIPLEQFGDEPVALGQTGYSFKLVRYLSHARLNKEGKLVNVEESSPNPAIEFDINGPTEVKIPFAFARFPEFNQMHGQDSPVKVVLHTQESFMPDVPLEILQGPAGLFYGRFLDMKGGFTVKELTIGEPVETPWPGIRFMLLEYYQQAAWEYEVRPREAIRLQGRTPAILLTVEGPGGKQPLWMQKYTGRSLSVGGQAYAFAYRDKTLPLGFQVTLDDFTIQRYPGTERPRAFESRVTLFDPAIGRKQAAIISMNHPATHDGLTLFQSSYRQTGRGDEMATILSVSWDPGQAIVFAGYFGAMLGLLWVLVVRMAQGGRLADGRTADEEKEVAQG